MKWRPVVKNGVRLDLRGNPLKEPSDAAVNRARMAAVLVIAAVVGLAVGMWLKLHGG